MESARGAISARRTLRTVVTFVALGISAGVAASWICAIGVHPGDALPEATAHTRLEDGKLWYVIWSAQPGHSEVMSVTGTFPEDVSLAPEPAAESVIPRWSRVRRPKAGRNGGEFHHVESAFGWPWLSLAFSGEYTRRDSRQVEIEVKSGILLYQPTLGSGDKPLRVLPLRPLWIGILCNSVFYGLGIWLLWFLKVLRPLSLLRRIRLRRGLCPTCGYPMGEATVCAECGAMLPSRKPDARATE